MSWPYHVIFPRGNRKLLDVAYVRDYEKADWALASRRSFETEEEAKEYMRELSEKHDIPCVGDQRYLD